MIFYKCFLLFLIGFFHLEVKGESKKFYDKKYFNNEIGKKYFPTTNMSGQLYFTIGSLSESSSTESLHFTYENKIRLNTSFKGSDKLLTIIESGNAFDSPLNLDLQSKKGETLKISTLLYQFKLDDEYELVIGPKMFGYNGLAGKSTAYNERIAILDGSNYTTSSGIGPGLVISTTKENGFNTTLKIASDSNSIDNESLHYISQVGLTKTNYGGTFTVNLNNEFNAYGLATFYQPGNFPAISASIEFKDDNSSKNIKNWVIGLEKSLVNKKIGIAVGTHNEEEKIAYEAWSKVNISDKLKIIPVFFVRENNKATQELGLSINTQFIY